MKLTPALYVRQFLASIHPPLPKTPRESQQLLNILETSFRKRLDEVHPSPRSTKDAPESAHRNIPLSRFDATGATNQYLHTILTNPLLDDPTRHGAADLTAAKSAVARFESALTEGQMTTAILMECVKRYAMGVKKGNKITNEQRLGPRIAAWFTSTSAQARENFFVENENLGLLVHIMAVDQQEHVVWSWLRTVYERDFGQGAARKQAGISDYRWLKVEDDLVSNLMQLSIRQREISDAAQQFVEASRYRVESGRANVKSDGATVGLMYTPLSSSWKRLAASIIKLRTRHDIPTDLYDKAIQLAIPWTTAPQFSSAVLSVYHPTSPDAQDLYQKLGEDASAEEFLSSHEKSGKSARCAMLTVILDAAQLCLDQGRPRRATFFLSFATSHYADILPAVTVRPDASIATRIQRAQDGLYEMRSHSYQAGLT